MGRQLLLTFEQHPIQQFESSGWVTAPWNYLPRRNNWKHDGYVCRKDDKEAKRGNLSIYRIIR